MIVFPLLLVARAREHKWPVSKMVGLIIVLSVILIPVGGSLTVAIAELRQREFSVESLVAYSQDLLSNTRDSRNLSRAVVDQVIGKFDSISTGAFLVETLGAGFAGWRPYEGAIAAIIPRMVLPDKPVPGSVDGTFWGHPSRLIPAMFGYGSDSASMGVSPGAIAIWQLGFGGLLFLVITNVVNLYLVNSLLLSSSLVSRTLGISLLGIPALVTLFASPDVLIMNAERTLVVYIFLYLAIKLLSRYHQRTFRPDNTRFHPELRVDHQGRVIL